jgi:hypothetical protein
VGIAGRLGGHRELERGVVTSHREWAMAIRCKCPNGHELKVKEKFAGQAGLCPRCGARVLVPHPVPALNDEAIVDLLGPPSVEEPENLPVHQEEAHRVRGSEGSSMSGVSLLSSSLLNRGTKVCGKCKKEVRVTYDICPHCRTYFTDLAEVSRRVTATCKVCGGQVQFGDVLCPHCGVDLRMS